MWERGVQRVQSFVDVINEWPLSERGPSSIIQRPSQTDDGDAATATAVVDDNGKRRSLLTSHSLCKTLHNVLNGLVKFVPAGAYHFCLNLPATFSQPTTSHCSVCTEKCSARKACTKCLPTVYQHRQLKVVVLTWGQLLKKQRCLLLAEWKVQIRPPAMKVLIVPDLLPGSDRLVGEGTPFF